MYTSQRECALEVQGLPAEIEAVKARIKPLNESVEAVVSKKDRFRLIGPIGEINRIERLITPLSCRLDSSLKVNLIDDMEHDYAIPDPS